MITTIIEIIIALMVIAAIGCVCYVVGQAKGFDNAYKEFYDRLYNTPDR